MSVLDQVTRLVQEALDDFDKPGTTVSSLLRRAIRIARLRNDFEGLMWLEIESNGVNDVAGNRRRMDAFKSHFTAEEYKEISHRASLAHISRRRWPHIDDKGLIVTGRESDKVNPVSVAELEADVASLQAQISATVPPEGLTPIDLYRRDESCREMRRLLTLRRDLTIQILERIRQAIHDYLSVAEHQLLYGQVQSDVFERNRAFVDAQLGEIAPEALAQFVSVYRRLAEGDDEARSQALTSCRRVLKSLADKLYPARPEPILGYGGAKHAVTDDKVINRLVQYVYETRRGHASEELLQASLTSFGLRFDHLVDATSKGVHSEVSQAEADQCAIQTYLLVGDLLRLRAGTSAVVVED